MGSTLDTKLVLRAASYGLVLPVFLSMIALGVPVPLFNILYALHRSPEAAEFAQLDFIEWYSGVGQIRDAMLRRGYAACGFDIGEDRCYEDFTSACGMLAAIQLFRALRYGGAHHWATVCSSWIWMSRGSTLRSDVFPLGFQKDGKKRCRSVAQGNLMVSNMSLFLLWSLAKRCLWIVEQPGSSLMWQHPRMQQVKKAVNSMCDKTFKYTSVETTMGAFGAPTVKPTHLHSCSDCLLSLARTLTGAERDAIRAQCTEEVVTKLDDGRVAGGPDLKGTQEYPRGYGEACADVLEAFQQRPEDLTASDVPMPAAMPDMTDDLWPDTSLENVCRLLRIPHDRLIG